MPSGYKRIKNDIGYFRKDHFCPDCKSKLTQVEVSRVVNSRSPEAKDFDFGMGMGRRMIGDIQFTWDEFECPTCRRHFSVNEIKQSEGIKVRASKSKVGSIIWYGLAVLLFLLYGFLKSKNISIIWYVIAVPLYLLYIFLKSKDIF